MKIRRHLRSAAPDTLTNDERKMLEKRLRERYPRAHRVKVVGTAERPIVELWEKDGKGHETARVGAVSKLLGQDA